MFVRACVRVCVRACVRECVCVCVCVCARAHVRARARAGVYTCGFGVGGIQYYVYILFCGFILFYALLLLLI